MWYNEIPEVSFSSWLSQLISLFNDTMAAVMSLPVLRFFLALLFFLVLVFFFVLLLRWGKKGF